MVMIPGIEEDYEERTLAHPTPKLTAPTRVWAPDPESATVNGPPLSPCAKSASALLSSSSCELQISSYEMTNSIDWWHQSKKNSPHRHPCHSPLLCLTCMLGIILWIWWWRRRPAQSMSEVMVTPLELIADSQTESETIGTWNIIWFYIWFSSWSKNYMILHVDILSVWDLQFKKLVSKASTFWCRSPT